MGRVRTRNLIDREKGVPQISLRAAAGESMHDASIAAEGLEDTGRKHEARAVMSTAISGASAMELYYVDYVEAK